jgi:Trypsin-like peptidase domain
LAYQYKRVKNSVVTVWTDRGAVDGMIVDAAGLVLTTQKPLDKALWLAVQFDDRHRLPTDVIVSDREKDIAVLRVNPAEVGAIPPAELSNDPGALVEGERVFVVENPGQDEKKKLTTGVLSKADQKEIVSDVKVTYPGAALFNSSGAVVGIMQINGKELHISPIAIAQPAILEARQKLPSAAPTSPHLLPTPPLDDFPADQLRAPGRGTWEKDFYSFKAGDFTVELVDPIASYESETDQYNRAMKDYAKHPKGKTEPTGPEHKYRPVLIIVAVPEIKTSWGSTILSGMAAGPYSTSPTYKHYKTGFQKMRMLCGAKEVEPIWPRRFIAGSRVDYSVVLADEAFSGEYYYTHDAISPQCGKVTLQLFATNDPEHPFEKVLDEKIVSRIWSDFEPYRKNQEPASKPAQVK